MWPLTRLRQARFQVQERIPEGTLNSALYRKAIQKAILKDRVQIGKVLKAIGVEQQGYPVETLFQVSTVARAPRYLPSVTHNINQARNELGLSSLIFEGSPWQLVARPDRYLSDRGSCYFWHPPTNREAKALPDMTWVTVDPAILPRPEGLEPFTNPEGQFLYVANFDDHMPQWWTGVLQQWEVTKLTDSMARGLLLDLSLPLVPRLRQPRNTVIPEDSMIWTMMMTNHNLIPGQFFAAWTDF